MSSSTTVCHHPHFIWNPQTDITMRKDGDLPELPEQVEEFLRSALTAAINEVPWLNLETEFAAGVIDLQHRRFTSCSGEFEFKMSSTGRVILTRN